MNGNRVHLVGRQLPWSGNAGDGHDSVGPAPMIQGIPHRLWAQTEPAHQADSMNIESLLYREDS